MSEMRGVIYNIQASGQFLRIDAGGIHWGRYDRRSVKKGMLGMGRWWWMSRLDIVNRNTDSHSESKIEESLIDSFYKVMTRMKGNQQWLVNHSDISNDGKPLLLSIGLKVKNRQFSELPLPVRESHPKSLWWSIVDLSKYNLAGRKLRK